jgi:hypothetical protein
MTQLFFLQKMPPEGLQGASYASPKNALAKAWNSLPAVSGARLGLTLTAAFCFCSELPLLFLTILPKRLK